MNNGNMNDQKIQGLWGHFHWLGVLAQQGSYTAAAARLGVSKAAVSQRIAELERMAAAPLVQRTTRSVRLTEAGQRLVDDTRGSFEHIAESFSRVSDLAGAPRGLLRVTAPVAFARQQLVPQLNDFLRQYPEIRLELDMFDRLASLATEGFDIAIRHTTSTPDTHVAWTLCATRSVLVTSRAYLRRRGAPQTPSDLKGHNCLHYPRSQDIPAWTLQPLNKRVGSESVTVQVSGTLAANNSEALRDAALGGLGIALVPDFSAQDSLRSGKLLPVLPQWKPVGAFPEQIYAIRPYSAYVPRAVQAFVTHFHQVFVHGFSVETGQPPMRT
jgi:DNA-binding transcriptional LysR family regulator